MLNVVCAGFGGQGVLTAGLLLAHVCMEHNKQVSWVPAYGSEMRGGNASCRLRISDNKILNPFFEQADLLLAMNQDSFDTMQGDVKEKGMIIANSTMVHSDTACNEIRVLAVAATEISASLKNPRGANIVMLGAAIAATGLFSVELFAHGIDNYFVAKGRNNPLNRECFFKGAQAIQ